MTYRCRLSDVTGRIFQRTMMASSPVELRSKAEREGFLLISFKGREKPPRRLMRNGSQAVLELTQSLAMMTESGLTLRESFDVATALHVAGPAALLVSELNERLRKGESFSRILAERRDIFPHFYTAMIRMGETLGRLDRILPSLADWLEQDKRVKEKIGGALLYPALVLSLVFLGMTGLIFFFLPYLEELTAGEALAAKLEPVYTAARGVILLFVAILVGIILFPLVDGLLRDRVKLTLPFLKRFIMTREMLSLCSALAVLTENGVPLEEALFQSAEVMGNRYLRERLLIIRSELLKGESLSRLLIGERSFPREISRWVALGERIGKTDRVFTQLSTYYRREMDNILNRLLALAEPSIIILLGGILMLIILKVILPLLTLYGGLA